MGIHGLTSYVAKHAEHLYDNYKLHNGVVLIDGNSAASLIYSGRTNSNHAFGGDYDRFANSTVEFVRLFEKCDVKPIFIFDGGYELRKLRTVLSRIKSNIMICGQYKNKYRESKTFPLMLRDVFRLILVDLDVTVVQCDFEADHELVALAKILRCPIISSDSDFYICDLMFVPFNLIDFKTVRFKKNNAKRRYYIPCKIFLIDRFLHRFGGLENRALLPLLSCALGNDYVPNNTFKNFLNMGHSTDFDSKIKRILAWLRSSTSVDDAIEQVMYLV